MHLLFQESEAPSAELVHFSDRNQSKGFGRKPIPRLEIREIPRGTVRDELPVGPTRVHGPRA